MITLDIILWVGVLSPKMTFLVPNDEGGLGHHLGKVPKSQFSLREGIRKKIRNYLGIFPNIGGGGLIIPKTFVILTIALKTPLKHLKITQKISNLTKKIK